VVERGEQNRKLTLGFDLSYFISEFDEIEGSRSSSVLEPILIEILPVQVEAVHGDNYRIGQA
jgi:hypothetical protein